jgi:hypothetical protein
MTTARVIISDALTFGLNRLSPGETLDADTGARCLDALNSIVDEWNGAKGFLFREILSAGAVTGASGTLGTTWAGLAPGDLIEGATVAYSAGMDIPLRLLTMEQYANIPLKATASIPQTYSPDGYATVYFYPACTGQTVTLRTRQVVSDFSDLDTDYGMPKGYRSALAALLEEKMAPTMAPSMLAPATKHAQAARQRIGAQAISPAISQPTGRVGNILAGWY